MATGRLTKTSVDRLQPPPVGEAWLWDTELRGFGVRVIPSGRKVYYLKYRVPGDRRARRLLLGSHGFVTPDQARQLARERYAEVVKGGDPAADRTRRHGEPTVREAVQEYLEETELRRKRTTAVEYHRLLKLHVLPIIGSTKLTDVSRDAIARLHLSLRKTPYLANRTLAVCSAFFTWAERRGLRPIGSNPSRLLEKFPERARERFLSTAEWQRLGKTLGEIEREGRYGWPMIAAIRFLALTGLRKQEALTLRWDNVDFEARTIRFADSKTGAKVTPLGAPAIELLSTLPREGDGYVFPGAKAGRPIASITNPWFDIRERAQLPDVRLHDLRHSYASIGASGGLSLLILGSLLGHRNATTTQRYAHLASDPRQAAADQISQEIRAALDTRVVTVTSLRRARRT